MSFYIVLPSNSSIRDFKDNTLTNYTTKLAKKLILKGEYEIGIPNSAIRKTGSTNVMVPSLLKHHEKVKHFMLHFLILLLSEMLLKL